MCSPRGGSKVGAYLMPRPLSFTGPTGTCVLDAALTCPSLPWMCWMIGTCAASASEP